ncbi:host cell factor 1 [Caerostris darwini]|uniref:Host cell factor 1 n=1 Tax=Caerostris darwini TaxID=1538125 RepID=A0AAV4QQH6_9ARAC|nr:host cell factor 1 [Caerostris darwini]
MAAPILKWKRVNNASGQAPRPRHGHRAVAIKDLMIVFGGGNEGIVDELHVFNTTNNQWFVPPVKGDIPPGCAAYGFVCDGTRLLVFGGMVEYGKYSNELYELAASKWEWKRLKPRSPKSQPPPCPRLGHSFTLIGNKVFLFGGLANDSEDPKNNIPRYLNDLYTLELRATSMMWDVPQCNGHPPPPRESHTAVAYTGKNDKHSRLIVYGGMSGCRLGDLWQLDIETMSWSKPSVQGLSPLPRSLHSATLIGHRMLVFGGWVPLVMDDNKAASHEKEWKCTNTLASLNLEKMTWEPLSMECAEDSVPRARAGHCSVAINNRLYIWSGRDGYRKAWNNQVCCKDLWFLETDKPPAPSRVQLIRASTNSLEVHWGAVPTGESYLLQLQKYDIPPSSPQMMGTGSQLPASPITQAPLILPPNIPTTLLAQNLIPPPTTAVAATSVTTPTAAQTQAVVRLSMNPISTIAPTGKAGTVTVVHSKNQTTMPSQQIRVVTQSAGGTHVVRPLTTNMISASSTTPTTTLSGMQALAAAAVASSKITTSATSSVNVSSIRVVAPSLLSSQGIKLGSVAGLSGQTVRMSSTTTLLKTPGQITTQGGKQIIVHKAPGGGNQPQIVTLVKTSQGQVAVAHVPKMSIVQGKNSALQGQQAKGGIPQGATIVKLVTTQANSAGAKPAGNVISTLPGSSPTTVLGIQTVSPQSTMQPKVITTIFRTLPTNILSGTKASLAGGSGTNTVSTATASPKQTFVIATPSTGKQGTQAKIISSVPKLAVNPNSLIVSSAAGGVKSILSTVSADGKAKTAGSSVSVLPLSSSGLNTITTPSGVKMIVVSSASLTSGQQGITIITTASTTGSQSIHSTVTSPITLTMPSSALGNKVSSITIPTKSLTSQNINQITSSQTGGAQILTLPAQGILQAKSTVIGGQKVLALLPSSVSTIVSEANAENLPVSAINASTEKILTEVQSSIVSENDSSPTELKAEEQGNENKRTPEDPPNNQNMHCGIDNGSTLSSQNSDVLSSKDESSELNVNSSDADHRTKSVNSINCEKNDEETKRSVCDDGVHCGTDDESDMVVPKVSKMCDDEINSETDNGNDSVVPVSKICNDGIHCGTDDEVEQITKKVKSCDDGIHCGTDDEEEQITKKVKICDDGIHCGTDDEEEQITKKVKICDDGIHCGTDDEDDKGTKSKKNNDDSMDCENNNEDEISTGKDVSASIPKNCNNEETRNLSSNKDNTLKVDTSTALSNSQSSSRMVPCQSALTLEQPGAEPPAQMLSDDPPVQSEDNSSEAIAASSLTKIATGRHSLATLATAASYDSSGSPFPASVDKKELVPNRQSSISSLTNNAESSSIGLKIDLNAIKQEASTPVKSEDHFKKENQWYDVGLFKEIRATVSHFYLSPESVGKKNGESDTFPDIANLKKLELQPGTAYKFRVAGVNSCGRGPWSEVSAFKTCLPGYPGAPSAIKISKNVEGAHLSWEAPQTTSGEIIEYSVYLAMRSATTIGQGDSKTVASNTSQLAFVRVYCGADPSCIVNSTNLSSAHIDMSTKPAIIFRIAARNEKGYGPATQVRWLQDGMNVSNSKTPTKRSHPSDKTSTMSKKVKLEES